MLYEWGPPCVWRHSENNEESRENLLVFEISTQVKIVSKQQQSLSGFCCVQLEMHLRPRRHSVRTCLCKGAAVTREIQLASSMLASDLASKLDKRKDEKRGGKTIENTPSILTFGRRKGQICPFQIGGFQMIQYKKLWQSGNSQCLS